MFRWCLILVFWHCAIAAQLKHAPVPESRIVGGTDGLPGQFPYQVSLRFYHNNRHFCGGSILNEWWILTAAHCTIDERPSTVYAVVGSHLLSVGGVTHKLAAIINHVNYNRMILENDIALLKTEQKIEYNLFVRPVALINREVKEGEELFLSGWGRTATNGPQPDRLKWLITNAVDKDECMKVVDGNQDTFCAFNAKDRGLCFGDSGGPLVAFDEGIVGVNSFVVSTCGSGYPDGFASVYFHREWINAIISN